ncbi:hypothetical protein [Methanolobus halotolerans]|uniref:Uncharacterized protein n=1 Tax=Methanolobus halotolerans TaxID=2052935 RepID=A0A4E0Q706_9EURY|nr:hypothetical protein [Methanolobus halotolerans]TGC10573.1 hypothetical protein CUN85_03510 [Methanolobus halotolerans]
MKIPEKVNNYSPDNFQCNTLKNFTNDSTAWIDLILSKTALIFASIIILAAVYHLTAEIQQADKQRQLDAMAQDFRSAIDSVGQSHYGMASANISYFFDTYDRSGRFTDQLNASVSGEYAGISYEEDDKLIYAVKPLAYKTLPYNESEIRNELLDHFSASGNRTQPIMPPFTYSNVTDLLTSLATKEKNLNTSTKVHIVKSLIYVVNNSEVRELEYILVYQ